jgi:hypothetical protein
MPVSVGFRAFRPASSFVSWDTDASPQSGTFHTRETSDCLKTPVFVNISVLFPVFRTFMQHPLKPL